MTRTIQGQLWLSDPGIQTVMDALEADGGAARFVGGCVRNALLGVAVSDIDIATPLLPEAVTERLRARGLSVIPTGIEHGTVTALAGSGPLEITTLRRDVETDGRRAVIAFTDRWEEDAGRRDFTINALYADRTGRVYDYFKGLADLEAGLIRFVGDAGQRIQEDYLRILRFFRMHAFYGRGWLNADGLAACSAHASGIDRLAGERIQKEMLRLFEAVDPAFAVAAMDEAGVLARLIEGPVSLNRLARIAYVERLLGVSADPLLRLSALLGGDEESARMTALRWRLSNDDKARLMFAIGSADMVGSELAAPQARALIYRWGAQTFQDRVRLHWASAADDRGGTRYRSLLTLAQDWPRPELPVDGHDVLAAGIAKGEAVGRVLAAVETLWVESDFALTRQDLLAEVSKLAGR